MTQNGTDPATGMSLCDNCGEPFNCQPVPFCRPEDLERGYEHMADLGFCSDSCRKAYEDHLRKQMAGNLLGEDLGLEEGQEQWMLDGWDTRTARYEQGRQRHIFQFQANELDEMHLMMYAPEHMKFKWNPLVHFDHEQEDYMNRMADFLRFSPGSFT